MNKERNSKSEWVLLAIGLIALWAIPHRVAGDGEVRYGALVNLIEHGSLAVPRYSILAPLFAAPLYLLGKLTGDTRGMAAHESAVLFTIALVILWRELRDEKPIFRRLTLALLIFGSMFPAHVQAFYGEVFTALAITVGVLWLARGKELAGWTAVILGAVNTPATVIGVAAIAVRMFLRTKKKAHLITPAIVLGLAFLENIITRGAPTATGYAHDAGFKTFMPYSGQPGFSYPFVLGLLSILLSFGKGLVFFVPGLFVPIAAEVSERMRWVQRTLVLVSASLVLVYAKWWAWYGGSFWGPRFFLIASIPASLALASHLSHKRLTWQQALYAALTLWVFWVGVNGLVFDQNGLELCFRDHYALETLCHFTPEYSVLFHPFVDFASSVPEKTRPLAIGVCVFWLLAAAMFIRGARREV